MSRAWEAASFWLQEQDDSACSPHLTAVLAQGSTEAGGETRRVLSSKPVFFFSFVIKFQKMKRVFLALLELGKP